MKRRQEWGLLLAWAILYIPYIAQGGWIRDDLAFLTATRGVQMYAQWQWFVSTNRDMTARPVSAILHGVSYWLLGSQAWLFHLVNLSLFGASVLFFYLAMKKLVSRDIAFVTSLLALVYPCASTTVFSSIMMNSNLAAFFWAGGLYVAAGNFRWKGFLTTALFVMSALSYEVFIPLFAFGTLINLFIFKLHRSDRKRLLLEAMPMVVAVVIYGIYRGLLEKAIFHTSFSRIVISSPPVLLEKFLASLASGVKIATVDSFVLSIRGFSNLGFVPLAYTVAILAGLALFGIYLYRERPSTGGEEPCYLGLIGLALCLFALAHLIYTFSNYVPDSTAFANRTMGGMRFVTAFLIAALAVPLHRGLAGQRVRQIAAIFLFAVFSLFTFATVGQSEAWILAGRWNEQVAADITGAMRQEPLDQTKPLMLVAVLPSTFAGEVDQEPILGVAWDITPLLSLYNPNLVINANVYNPSAIAGPQGVTIQNFDHPWQADYPLWLYTYDDHKMYQVISQADWDGDLALASSRMNP